MNQSTSIPPDFFFSIRVFHRHWRVTGQQAKGGDHLLFYSTTHLLTNIQTFILQLWDDNHIFQIAPLVFTRLLLDEIYHLIELLFDWLMMWAWFVLVYLLIWFKDFIAAIWYWKPVDSNSHWLLSLYSRNNLKKSASDSRTLPLVIFDKNSPLFQK